MTQAAGISLLELNQRIRETLKSNLPTALWVRAEIAEFREHRNGHCYLELVEKDPSGDQVVARLRAMIWAYQYRSIKPFFETATGRPLGNGIKVLVQGVVDFQELYGMSFQIRNIDPAYTLGDLEQRRQEVLQRLRSDGVINMNKGQELPLVPQRIAVISSETAAGYGDFIQQLSNNAYGLKFYCKLFPALMQGEQAPSSIISALDRIYAYEAHFDVVVLIRGGGAALDLLCFDDYDLAYHLTQFPLPVITGIGHDRDVSVADMVAHTSAKTPTAVAEFLISGAAAVLERVESAARLLKTATREQLQGHRQGMDKLAYQTAPLARRLLSDRKYALATLARRLPSLGALFLQQQHQRLMQAVRVLQQAPARQVADGRRELQRASERLSGGSRSAIHRAGERLQMLERANRLNDPVEVLKRGYSMSYSGGKVVKEVAGLQPGEVLETVFRDGRVQSKVIEVKIKE